MMSPKLAPQPPRGAGMLLTIREVAERLAISRRHVFRLISRGELAAIRIGKVTRVRILDLEQFIERHRS